MVLSAIAGATVENRLIGMGEYYLWFNADKREQLGIEPFDTGAKMVSNIDVGNEYTDAICTLLDSYWRGDMLVFLGDYRELDNEENPALAKIEADCGHREPCALCEAEDIYVDVAGRFRLAKGKTYYDCESPGLPEVPYEGTFDKEVIHYRYVINETKRQYYDRERTPMTSTHVWRDGGVREGIQRLDLLPVFLGAGAERYGDGYLDGRDDVPDPSGMWIGDYVRVSHEPPQEGYEDLSDWYYYPFFPLITEADDEILPIMQSQAFKDAIADDEEGEVIDHALRLIRQSLDGNSSLEA